MEFLVLGGLSDPLRTFYFSLEDCSVSVLVRELFDTVQHAYI